MTTNTQMQSLHITAIPPTHKKHRLKATNTSLHGRLHAITHILRLQLRLARLLHLVGQILIHNEGLHVEVPLTEAENTTTTLHSTIHSPPQKHTPLEVRSNRIPSYDHNPAGIPQSRSRSHYCDHGRRKAQTHPFYLVNENPG